MPVHGTYKTSDVAKAAGVPIKKLNRNLDRKVIKTPGPEPGKGPSPQLQSARHLRDCDRARPDEAQGPAGLQQ